MRTQQHMIDDEAKLVFKKLLPREWSLQGISPDYGIDYNLTVYAAERPTPLQVAIQLKGTREAPRVGDCVHFRFEVERLAQYLDVHPLAVFLVVVDVTTEQAWFVHLQRYALDHLRDKAWRVQKTVTISLPLANDVRDAATLRAAISKAVHHASELRPAAPVGALIAHRKRIESLDPRLVVRASADESGERYEIRAREPVSLGIRFASPVGADLSEQMRLLRQGEPVDFAAGDVTFEGSPAFAEVGLRDTTLQIAMNHPMPVTVLAKRGGKVLAAVRNLSGQMIRALAATRFEATLGDGILRVNALIDESAPGDTVTFKVTVTVGLDAWNGLPLLDLPYFEEIAAFVEALGGPVTVALRLHLPGRDKDMPAHRFNDPNAFASVIPVVRVVRQAREVAAKAGVNPTLPDDLDEDIAEEVNRAHMLICAGGFEKPGEDRTLTVLFSRPATYIPSADLLDLEADAIRGADTIPFLGTDLHARTKALTFTRVQCVATDVDSKTGLPRVTFRGTSGSRFKLVSEFDTAPSPEPQEGKIFIRSHRPSKRRSRLR